MRNKKLNFYYALIHVSKALQWRASIGLFNSKCVIKQRVMVKVSMAFIFYYMSCLLKWAACSCKLLSNVFSDIVCNLFLR